MKIKLIPVVAIIAGLLFSIVFLSCSSVFTGSISGELHDEELFDNLESDSGISEALVYLYIDADNWAADYTAWETELRLPDQPGEEVVDAGYFLSTVTDSDGAFSFNGIIWDSIFPAYGKTADRRDIFFIFYHPDYGLTKSDTSIYIVSDVNNTLAPIRISRAVNTADIKGNIASWVGGAGSIYDTEALSNVEVNIYVPESWEYSGSAVINAVYGDSPDYTFTTDEYGDYSGQVSYPYMPNKAENIGTTSLLLEFVLDGYTSDSDWDSDISEDADLDGDGVATEPVYRTVITADELNVLNDIQLKQTDFTQSLSGRVYDVSSGAYVSGKTVKISLTNPETGKIREYSGVTSTKSINDTTSETGHFSIDDISWEDSSYTGNASDVALSLSVDGEVVSDGSDAYTLSSNDEAYHEINVD